MTRLYTFLAALLLAVSIKATVKMNSTPVQVTQRDGTQLTVIGYGDEHDHYFTTTDGVLLVHQGNDFYVAQVTKEGRLKATSQLAHEKAMRSPFEQQLAMAQDHQLFAQSFTSGQRRSPLVRDINPTYRLFPCSGSPKALVLLAQFQDKHFIDDDPVPVFDQYFNADKIDQNLGNGTARRNYGGVRKYYHDMSFGQFNPQFDVYGTFTLSQPMAYYGADVNIGTEEEPDVRVDYNFKQRLIPELCQLAASQGVDFSQYDGDGDGYVDLLYILYADYAQSWARNSTNCLWPKSGLYECGPYNGCKVCLYSINSELNAFPGAFDGELRINGIGLSCHEFGHCLGLPDIYPTANAARRAYNPSMEYWDLMDAGEYVQNGYYPTEFTAWEREALGWMEIETLNESGHYTLPRISEESRKAYRIPNPDDQTGNEYILLQNIQDTLWNRRQLGHGMLVMHVDFDSIAFSLEGDPENKIPGNTLNNTIGHPRFTFIPADGEYISQYAVDDVNITTAQHRASHGGDPYPGTSGVTDIYGFNMYTGTMHKHIRNITETDKGIIEFDFLANPDPTGIQTTPSHNRKGKAFSLSGIAIGNQTSWRGVLIVRDGDTFRKVLSR